MATDITTTPVDDVHVHYVPGWWHREVPGAAAPIHRDISDLDVIADGAREGDVGSRRVLSASIEILYGTHEADPAALRRLNAAIAEDVAAHPDALLGLASIDAFAGASAGDEVRHAIEELGLAGIIVDSGRGAAVIGEPSTLPALEAAAELGVPVFVHPVWTEDVADVEAASGRSAAAWGRGYRNGLALIHLLHADVLRAIPNLRVVFTSLGVGSLFFAHQALERLRTADGAPPEVYFDTTALHPASIRYALDVLGPERIVLGTDWPFHDDDRAAVLAAVGELGLAPDDEERVLNGNFRSLFTRNVVRS
jgi:predicted TIM-barrel fold metal-dependent hydrolase